MSRGRDWLIPEQLQPSTDGDPDIIIFANGVRGGDKRVEKVRVNPEKVARLNLSLAQIGLADSITIEHCPAFPPARLVSLIEPLSVPLRLVELEIFAQKSKAIFFFPAHPTGLSKQTPNDHLLLPPALVPTSPTIRRPGRKHSPTNSPSPLFPPKWPT